MLALSNSDQGAPRIEALLAQDGDGFGVDRITTVVAVRPPDYTSVRWQENRLRPSGSSRWLRSQAVELHVGGAHGYLEVTRLPDGSVARLDINPARIHDPSGHSLWPTADLPYAISAAWAVATEWVEPMAEITMASVKRIDLARDLTGIESIPALLEALPGAPAPHARRRVLDHDGTGTPTTFTVGNKTGGLVRVYDRQHHDPSLRGAVRVEVQSQSWTERYGGIKTVADLAPTHLAALFLDRWEWAGLDLSVRSSSDMLRAVANLSDEDGMPWSQAKRERFVGAMVMEGLGHGAKDPSG
jgi:hypothetical protein